MAAGIAFHRKRGPSTTPQWLSGSIISAPHHQREYVPLKGECKCGAGNGLRHEYLETAKRDGSYGGTFVLVCTECGGRAQPDIEQALRESGVDEETISQILSGGGASHD
jgi:hypothetical protein